MSRASTPVTRAALLVHILTSAEMGQLQQLSKPNKQVDLCPPSHPKEELKDSSETLGHPCPSHVHFSFQSYISKYFSFVLCSVTCPNVLWPSSFVYRASLTCSGLLTGSVDGGGREGLRATCTRSPLLFLSSPAPHSQPSGSKQAWGAWQDDSGCISSPPQSYKADIILQMGAWDFKWLAEALQSVRERRRQSWAHPRDAASRSEGDNKEEVAHA